MKNKTLTARVPFNRYHLISPAVLFYDFALASIEHRIADRSNHLRFDINLILGRCDCFRLIAEKFISENIMSASDLETFAYCLKPTRKQFISDLSRSARKALRKYYTKDLVLKKEYK